MHVRHLACWVLLLCCSPALARPKAWQKAFAKGFESPNSWERRAALEQVDVGDKKGVRVLLELLAEERLGQVDWYVREGLIERLAQVEGGKALKYLLKGLEVKQDRVREGVVLALGKRKDPEQLPLLVKATRDRSPRVQRAAVQALSAFPEQKQAVEAILEAWDDAEEVSRLGLLCARSLAWISGEDRGLNRASWAAWWQPLAKVWPTKAPPPPEEKDDEPMRTRVRGVKLTYTERGKGTLPLLVIPNYATTPDLYRPWLKSVEDIYRVIYMQLPKIGDFPQDDLKEFAPGMPYYPVDLLVDAFDDLRQELGVDHFALFAHGYNSLIAMRYLSRHPDQVAQVILVGPISGGQAWGRIVDAVQRHGQATQDPELMHMARNLLVYPDGKHDYETSSDEEWQALRRKSASLYLADPNDPALVDLFERGFYDDKDEDAVTPDFELSRQEPAQVPILLQFGEQSLWSLEADQKKFTDHYPQVTLHTYAHSALLPFMEETAAWSQDVHAFFAEHAPKQD